MKCYKLNLDEVCLNEVFLDEVSLNEVRVFLHEDEQQMKGCIPKANKKWRDVVVVVRHAASCTNIFN